MRCDQQVCLVCGVRNHFLDFASTGLCAECAPPAEVGIVASVAAPVPDLRAYDDVLECEVTEEMPTPSEWLERVA